jgi:hypothetical protein
VHAGVGYQGAHLSSPLPSRPTTCVNKSLRTESLATVRCMPLHWSSSVSGESVPIDEDDINVFGTARNAFLQDLESFIHKRKQGSFNDFILADLSGGQALLRIHACKYYGKNSSRPRCIYTYHILSVVIKELESLLILDGLSWVGWIIFVPAASGLLSEEVGLAQLVTQRAITRSLRVPAGTCLAILRIPGGHALLLADSPHHVISGEILHLRNDRTS